MPLIKVSPPHPLLSGVVRYFIFPFLSERKGVWLSLYILSFITHEVIKLLCLCAAPELFTTYSVFVQENLSISSKPASQNLLHFISCFYFHLFDISRIGKVFLTFVFLPSFVWPQNYTSCRCISGSYARPAPCPNRCPHFLLPVILVISLASLVACLTHNPMYMMVLRYGNKTLIYFIFDTFKVSSDSNMSWVVWPLEIQLTVFSSLRTLCFCRHLLVFILNCLRIIICLSQTLSISL